MKMLTQREIGKLMKQGGSALIDALKVEARERAAQGETLTSKPSQIGQLLNSKVHCGR